MPLHIDELNSDTFYNEIQPLPLLTDFCKKENIPFNMNERRLFQLAKSEYIKDSFYHALAQFIH